MRVHLLCCAWLAAFVAAQAQTPSPILDGSLNDSFWQQVAAERLKPSEPGVPAALGGEVRAAIVGRYLCVAARLPEPDGRVTARSVGRNPAWEDEDLLRITAGPDIGYSDRVLQVNPLGAYSLEKAGHVVWKSESTYPYSDEREAPIVNQNIDKFLVATNVGAREWTVELSFPLSEVSAPGPDSIFVRIERIRAQRPGSPRQHWHWPALGPSAKVPVIRAVAWDAPPPLFRPPLIGNSEAPLEVAKVEQVPPLDSGWESSPWSNAPAAKLLLDEPSPRLPRVPTEVKMLHDGRVLAVLAKCAEPDRIMAEVKENDGSVGSDDSFHVYLATSGSVYVQIAANALGYLRDAMGFSGGPRISRAREWDSGTRVAVRREAGAWTARLDIPLEPVAEALGEERIPEQWRILLMRVRRERPGEARETSVLPIVQSETPLCPARYRRLDLTGLAPGRVAKVAGPPPAPFDGMVLSHEERRRMGVAEMLDRQIRGRVRQALEAERGDRQRVNSREEWERFREPRLKALRAWLGGFPPRVSLQTRVTKEYRGDGYRRQNLLYRSRPGLWVTANLYLPANPPGQMPGIVIIHSHHRPRTQAELQDMGILWARAGCAVLIMDQIGHGERIETYPWNREGYHSRYTTGMQLYLAGESLIKWIVWDVMRGVDLLLERGDVNKNQIILLGAVAAGGDPAAVAAAIDPRIAAVAPFNFGEATPELGAGMSPWPAGLADPGWGEWETTRCLPNSIRDQFLPWTICASVAPRRFIFSYEMGWDVEKVPAWSRYRKVFGFYNALDHLGEAHGFGGFPGPGECANIGPSQRKTLYPELERWFAIPAPAAEPEDRRPGAELASLTPEVAATLTMRSVHELAFEIAEKKLQAARSDLARMDPAARRKWLQQKWAAKLGDIEPNRQPETTLHWTKSWRNAKAEGLTLEVERGITTPMLLMLPASAAGARLPVVTIVSQGGKERLLTNRRDEIEALLQGGVAVCLPDVRGNGETSSDLRRCPQSDGISLAATELMLGNTLLGARLKDIRTVIAYLGSRPDLDPARIGVWGDSDVPVNPERLLTEETAGWRIGPEIEQQAEPLGGLLAILAGLYEDKVRAVAVRRGLVGYLSVLEDCFTYVPSDVIVPGILEAGDIGDAAAALSPHPLLLEGLVDGRNRAVSGAALRRSLEPLFSAYHDHKQDLVIRGEPGESSVADWLLTNLRR